MEFNRTSDATEHPDDITGVDKDRQTTDRYHLESTQEQEQENEASGVTNPGGCQHERPRQSFLELIAMAIKESETKQMSYQEIFENISKKFPYFRSGTGPQRLDASKLVRAHPYLFPQI